MRKRNEDLDGPKHDAFVRIAERRVSTALRVIDRIGNLANRNSYHFSAEEAQMVTGAIRNATDKLAARFSPRADAFVFKL